MEADEVESLIDLEVPHITESDKIKLRLKKFCYAIGFLFILWIISIIIVIPSNSNSNNNKEDPTQDTQDTQDDNIPKDEAYIKAEEFISNLNSQEIIGLLKGKNNINENKDIKLCEGQIAPFTSNEVVFKGMCIQDGTTGVRFSEGKGILWQSQINTAATFNETLMYKIGKAQGAESKEKGINTLLSPSVNIMKKPQNGILWESFGDDPFYSGVCASKIISGIQESGVIATIKHFLGNVQEIYEIPNKYNPDINALMDIYVEPFYRAIHEEDVRAVMAGNNTFNRIYCYKNEYLLTNILRNYLNFKGFIISDLYDVDNTHNYDCSLLDLYLEEECNIKDSCLSPSEKCMNNQTDINERFNESAKRIIAAMYKMNQMEDYPEVNLNKTANETEMEERKKIQKEAAIESQVLLKNEDNILPLKNNTTIAVIGNIAVDGDYLIKEKLENVNIINVPKPDEETIQLECDNGANKFGSFISPLQEIIESAKKKKITVMSSKIFTDEIDIKKNEKDKNKKALEKIKKKLLNQNPDAVIVFITSNSKGKYSILEENTKNECLWNGANELINEIKNDLEVIVVINAPIFDNPPWLKEVKAVLFSGFPGKEASHAIAEILIGEANPSGHLPFTWADYKKPDFAKLDEKFENTLIDRNDGIDNVGLKDNKGKPIIKKDCYPEGLYIGQRWFNKYKQTNYIFPFGFGLSYTSFIYSELNLSINKKGLIAEFNVTNNGFRRGQAVPMMFMNFPDSIGDYPKYIFKGFKKVELESKETKRVNISVDDHALSYFKDNKYIRVDNGTFEVFIAENGNIDESKLRGTIEANYTRDETE